MPEDNWNTRRAFLGKAMVGSIAFSLPILNNGSARANANANANAYTDCLANAYNDYFLDRLGAGRIANPVVRAAALVAARAAYVARLAACAALQAGRVVVASATATADWIAAHPGAVLGTIVVIGGVVFVVSGGAGGLIFLAPAAARLTTQ